MLNRNFLLLCFLCYSFFAVAQMPAILTLEEASRVKDEWLSKRVEHILPELMRREGIDMWLLISREYNEDPVLKTFLPSTWLSARRTTMLVMYKKLSFRYMFGDGPAWVAGVGPRWKWSTKHHHVLHIPEEAMLQCIHLAWCYMNEGFVGVMKNVGESCRYSFKAAHRSATICRKWAMGTCIMLMFAMQDKSGECMLGRHGVAVLRAEDSREVHEDDEGEEFFGFGFDDMHLG